MRGNRLGLAVATLIAFALAIPTHAGAGQWYDWPGMKKCSTFKADKQSGGYTIKVYASKHTQTTRSVTCRRAERIQKEYWNGDRSDSHYHPSGDYVTLDRFPGWKCGSGAGGGLCRRGQHLAGYQN